MTVTITTPIDREIVLTRRFAAPRQLVFDAHTKPELLRRWFGPHGWTLAECEIELRPGGAWHYLMHGPDGAEMTLRGVYLEVDPPERLVTTESNVDCEARAEHESLATTVLVEHAGATTLTTTVRFPTREIRDAVLESGMEHGVAEGFDRLDELLRGGTTEISARYRGRADAFERIVVAVAPRQWDGRSPCADWSVRDVVRHIVDMHGVLLGSAGRAPSPAPTVDVDPAAAFGSVRADIQVVLDDPATAGIEFDAPHVGRTTVERSIDEVISADLVLHGWDVARSTGQDDTMDPDEVELAFQAAKALPEDVLRLPYVFGPPVPVPADASPQDRLLGFIGRDPNWAV